MVKHIIVIDIVGLESRHISEETTPNIFKISKNGEIRELQKEQTLLIFCI